MGHKLCNGLYSRFQKYSLQIVASKREEKKTLQRKWLKDQREHDSCGQSDKVTSQFSFFSLSLSKLAKYRIYDYSPT